MIKLHNVIYYVSEKTVHVHVYSNHQRHLVENQDILCKILKSFAYYKPIHSCPRNTQAVTKAMKRNLGQLQSF